MQKNITGRRWDEPIGMSQGDFEGFYQTVMVPDSSNTWTEIRELYLKTIKEHPISRVHQWRLEKLEWQAQTQKALNADQVLPAWADDERKFYVGVLNRVLNAIDNALSQRLLNNEQANAILKAGQVVLTGTPISSGFGQLLLLKRRSDHQPTAHQALWATLEMLDALHAIRPEAAVEFWEQEKKTRHLLPKRSSRRSGGAGDAAGGGENAR